MTGRRMGPLTENKTTRRRSRWAGKGSKRMLFIWDTLNCRCPQKLSGAHGEGAGCEKQRLPRRRRRGSSGNRGSGGDRGRSRGREERGPEAGARASRNAGTTGGEPAAVGDTKEKLGKCSLAQARGRFQGGGDPQDQMLRRSGGTRSEKRARGIWQQEVTRALRGRSDGDAAPGIQMVPGKKAVGGESPEAASESAH